MSNIVREEAEARETEGEREEEETQNPHLGLASRKLVTVEFTICEKPFSTVKISSPV